MEMTCLYSKPGEVEVAWPSARTRRPVTISNTQLAATWAPIRIWRVMFARWRCRPTCQAGVSPNRIADAKPVAKAKTETRQSGAGSSHAGAPRSEERRVGKEGRSGGSQDH